ncbi:MAG: 50S ribosomal protein L29 [Bacteroidota bacterium]
MKITEIRNMTTDELNEKLQDSSKKLSQLKFNNTVQTIENPLEIKNLRRQIAKLKTVLNEKKQD